MTHRARLEPQVRCVNTCTTTDGARRAQNCALYTSVCFVVSVPLFAMCSRLFMLCVRMYAVCRSQMFVNMRCRIHSLYTSGGGPSWPVWRVCAVPVCSIDSRYSPCSSSTSSISATEESREPGRPLAPSNDPQHPCVLQLLRLLRACSWRRRPLLRYHCESTFKLCVRMYAVCRSHLCIVKCS